MTKEHEQQIESEAMERPAKSYSRDYMKMRDKHGWPIERIAGRPITNLIRVVLHVSLLQTWRKRKSA